MKQMRHIRGCRRGTSDEDFVQRLTSGEFTAEYTWWLRQMFLFVHDSKFVSGRDWRPVPAGVQANMQVTSGAIVDEAGADDEEGDRVLKQIATFVERPLQGDNRNLVVKALEVESAEPAEHLIPRLGLSEKQARYQENDGTRRAAYRVFH